ncbi:unnamed protein product [Lupinus luteus]|uniref:DYW domain-containing protein n=1 Tax=Lupinus luteus TaxID=3873 RepID=A0AAV1VUH6_LUPLU
MECLTGTSVVSNLSSFQTLLLPISQVQTFSFQLPTILFYNSKSPLISVPFKSSSATTQLCHPTSISTHEKSLLITKTVPSGKRHGSVPQRENIEEEHKNVNTKLRLKYHSSLLGDCALRESLNEGMAIHGHQIKNGVDQDTHFWISLINFYAKCGCHNYARQVLDEMPEQDVVSWTALIQGFVGQGNGTDGIALFCEMRKKGIRPNEFTVTTCLKACSMCLDMNFGKQVHAEAIKLSLLSDMFIGSALVNLYAKCGEMDLADKVFFCMPEQNEVLWNVLINGHAQVGNGKGAFRLFCHMLKSEVKFSKFTFPSVLKSCANSGDFRDGQAVHGLVFKSGCELDKFLCSSLIDMYSKCDLVGDALKLFLMITDHDVVSWSAMITCLDQQGHSQEAAKLFYSMRQTSVKPNQFTFSSVVSAATELGDLLYGQSIHACIFKHGLELDISVSNALIRMYMKHGCVRDGARVFEALTRPDIVSWNNLLSGFHDYGSCESGPKTFYQMLVEGFRPNMYTFISVLRSCSSLLDIVFGKQVHAQILKNNLDGNEYVGTALVDMYAKCRCMEESHKTFARLMSRDVFTWTIMITGYAQTGQAENSIKFFNLMQQEGVKPNEFTVAGCLRGCSQITVAESGMQLHSMAIKSGLLPDMYVSSALIDMYAKCGCIEDAETIFKGSVRQDTVVWNTMICGFSMHGWADKALQTFQSMKDEGNLPDETEHVLHNIPDKEKKEHLNHHSEKLALAFALISSQMKRIRIFKNLRICLDCHNFMKLVSDITNQEIIVRDINRFHHFKAQRAAQHMLVCNTITNSCVSFRVVLKTLPIIQQSTTTLSFSKSQTSASADYLVAALASASSGAESDALSARF